MTRLLLILCSYYAFFHFSIPQSFLDRCTNTCCLENPFFSFSFLLKPLQVNFLCISFFVPLWLSVRFLLCRVSYSSPFPLFFVFGIVPFSTFTDVLFTSNVVSSYQHCVLKCILIDSEPSATTSLYVLSDRYKQVIHTMGSFSNTQKLVV